MTELDLKLRTYRDEFDKLKERCSGGVESATGESTNQFLKSDTVSDVMKKAELAQSGYSQTEIEQCEKEKKQQNLQNEFKQSLKVFIKKTSVEKDTQNDKRNNFINTADSVAEKTENPLIINENEDLGVFEADNLLMKKSNQKRFTTRMKWNETDKNFLDSNGEIVTDKTLVRAVPIKYYSNYLETDSNGVDTVPNYEVLTQFVPGYVYDSSFSGMRNLIKVEIKNVHFLMHRLSSVEFYHAERLRRLYTEYKKLESINREEYYRKRIDILRNILSSGEEEKLDVLHEIVAIEEKLDNEEMKMRQFRDEMYNLWHDICNDRNDSKVTGTKVVLTWMSSKMTEEEKAADIEQQEKELNTRADEIMMLNELIGGEDMDKKDIIEDMRSKRSEMGLRLPGENKYIPVLEESVTTEISDMPEKYRVNISEAQDTYIYVKVFVGDVCSTSLASTLNLSFTSNVGFGTKVLVTHIPKYVKVQVWEQGIRGVHKIAEVAIPVYEGQPTSYDEFSFTCEEPTEEGILQEGVILGAAFIATNPKLTAHIIQETKARREAREKLGATHLPDIVRTNIMKDPSLDPNDPVMIQSMTIDNNKNRANKSINEFTLDEHKKTISFDAMEPTTKYKDSLVFKKKEKSKADEILPARVFERNDVVREPLIPPLFKWFCSLFEKKRLLRPVELQKEIDSNINQSTKMIINITRFINEPIRTKMSLIPEVIKSTGFSSEKSEKCSFFVIATLGDKTFKTDQVKSVNGYWKACFEFNVGLIRNCMEQSLNIAIFDKVKYSFPEGDQEEDHFIGDMSIPVSSLEFNGKTSAEFLLNVPPLHLGYSYQGKPMLVAEIGFYPAIQHNRQNVYYFNGVPVHLSSLIKEQNLPKGITEVNALLRFSSMIPWIKNIDNSVVDSQKFIDRGFGTSLEHALFFCNCLKTLKKNPLIVIAGDPFLGEAAFVYTNEEGVIRFYDAVNNKMYSGPPFRTPYIAFDDTNVWINANSVWRKIPAEGESLQESSIEYAETEDKTDEIEEKLKDEIKDYIKTLIPGKISWNKSLSVNLEAIIETCEEAAEKRTSPDEGDFFSDDSFIRANGAPFCKYLTKNTTIDELLLDVCVTIQNQKYYIMKGPKSKLGLSVKAYPHPNGIVAIWVFLATIQKLPKEEKAIE